MGCQAQGCQAQDWLWAVKLRTGYGLPSSGLAMGCQAQQINMLIYNHTKGAGFHLPGKQCQFVLYSAYQWHTCTHDPPVPQSDYHEPKNKKGRRYLISVSVCSITMWFGSQLLQSDIVVLTTSLWNSLPGVCFPPSYDLSCFKRNLNPHLQFHVYLL